MGERKIYRSLVRVDEVLRILESYRPLEPLGEEEVSLTEALGRVLSRHVFSPIDYPPYTRALVDGYAVISQDLVGVYEDRPRTLRLVGKVSTGETRLLRIGPGETVEVSTGAVLPYPADAVAYIEYTQAIGDSVTFYRSVSRGDNIDMAGSDIARGEIVAWKGDIVTPLVVSALAATGVSKVWVYKRANVGIIPTGNEIRSPGERLEYGQLYDSNSYMVYSLLKLLGARPRVYERVPDDLAAIEETLHRALSENDVVVTIGGTSAGLEDYTFRAMSKLSPGIIVHGVREKPGRPLVVALHGEKIIFGLPGFPMSCLLAANLYLLPVVARLQGLKLDTTSTFKAEITLPIKNEPGIRYFVPAVLKQEGGVYKAFPLPGHSGRVSSMVLFDGFIVVKEEDEYLPQGSKVEVMPNPFSKPYEVNIIGSHDPLLQEIVGGLPQGVVRMVNVGSTAGLQAVKSGVGDIAGTHLLDPATGEYNLPYLKQYGITGAVLVRGYLREQGFVFRHEIGSVESLLEVVSRGLSFVNRNPGSGTRVLIDKMLEEESRRSGVDLEEIKKNLKGYTFEVKTHEAVAYLVSQGVADVGVALRFVAEKYGLAFKSLTWERYDLLVNAKSLSNPRVRSIIERVKNLTREDLEAYAGYKVDGETGKEITF
ncbi:MAG: molybdopterin biosynthesis protein [Infirmifilum sp.]